MKRNKKTPPNFIEIMNYEEAKSVDDSMNHMNPFSLDDFKDTTGMDYPLAVGDIKDIYEERKKRAFTNPTINPNCLLHPDMRPPEEEKSSVEVTVNNNHKCCNWTCKIL